MNVNDKVTKATSRLPYAHKSNCAGSYRVFAVIITIIIVYFFIIKQAFGYKFPQHDYLNNIILENSVFGSISWWPISHFILFFILGILFPDCDVIVITAGILWEVVEEILGRTIGNDTATSMKNGIQYSRWWSGSIKDIVFNIAGFYTGKLLVKAFNKKPIIPYINDENVVPK